MGHQFIYQGAFADEMVGAKVDHHGPADLEEKVGKEVHPGRVEGPSSRRVFGEQIVDIDGQRVAEADRPAGVARLERIQVILQQQTWGEAVFLEKSKSV